MVAARRQSPTDPSPTSAKQAQPAQPELEASFEAKSVNTNSENENDHESDSDGDNDHVNSSGPDPASEPAELAEIPSSSQGSSQSPSPSQSSPKEDENRQLIMLCVRVLKAVSPQGMTTKEMSAALEVAGREEPGFKGISSSILSSKLNSFFRRFHGDNPNPDNSQLAVLPMTRESSRDGPRRLVYRWTPEALPAQPRLAGEQRVLQTQSGASRPIAEPVRRPRRSSEPRSPRSERARKQTDTEPEARPDAERPNETRPRHGPLGAATPEGTSEDEDAPRPASQNGRKRPLPIRTASFSETTPLAARSMSTIKHHSTHNTHGHSHGHGPATPPADDEPPLKRRAHSLGHLHSKSLSDGRVNLYYDAVDVCVRSPKLAEAEAIPEIPRWDHAEIDELAAEYESPEALSPEELDTLVF